MSECLFCKIVKGEIPGTCVYQDKNLIVIEDIHPAAPVHVLIIPKKHVDDFMGASETLLGQIFSAAKKLIKEKHITHYRLVNNGGGAAFIEHLHVHLLGSVAQDRNL